MNFNKIQWDSLEGVHEFCQWIFSSEPARRPFSFMAMVTEMVPARESVRGLEGISLSVSDKEPDRHASRFLEQIIVSFHFPDFQ